MSEPENDELTEPGVADVPELDQDPEVEYEEAEHEEAAAREAEPEPEPEPEGLQQAEWEAIFKKTEQRFATYTRAITDIWGDEAVNLLPVVVSPSAPPGFLHKADAGRVPDEIKTPILEFFGIVREQAYEPDPETETCRSCKGKGKTKTGSTVAARESRPCPTCGGWGYTIQGRAPSAQAKRANGVVEQADEIVGPLVTDERDNWGEPQILPDGRLNPNYGKQPQFKEPVEPYGITAGLGATEAAV